ncbi:MULTISPECIES: hypothetical protein [unclassified Sphingomonas]|uniref:hypothetical protein n=1 Tax=unclassified Sphingomonas TaxID=196159 RepID=UPI000AAE51F9|nr:MULTISPECIES: hypothetical protein [unclassified Sphingomonas]MDY0966942.1 hypothetical protein [Sphingomonas sp. CFBP9021]
MTRQTDTDKRRNRGSFADQLHRALWTDELRARSAKPDAGAMTAGRDGRGICHAP